MSVNVSNALEIPGWTSAEELIWLAEQAQKCTCIAEIGSWKGRSTRALADNTRGTVHAVDTWKGTAADGHYKELVDKPHNWLYGQFYANAGFLSNVETFQQESVFVAHHFARCGFLFHMIFIDAAHDYVNVKADIRAWRPLLAPGGLLCGHDYDAGRPGVVQAVKEFFPNVKKGPGSIWIAE